MTNNFAFFFFFSPGGGGAWDGAEQNVQTD